MSDPDALRSASGSPGAGPLGSPSPASGTGGAPSAPLGPGSNPAAPVAGGSAGSPAGGPIGSSTVSRRKQTSGARSFGRGLAAALLVFVTVVLVLFVVFNTQSVDISLVFGNVHAPLVIALVVAAGLGGLLVGLAALMVRTRRGAARRAAAKEAARRAQGAPSRR